MQKISFIFFILVFWTTTLLADKPEYFLNHSSGKFYFLLSTRLKESDFRVFTYNKSSVHFVPSAKGDLFFKHHNYDWNKKVYDLYIWGEAEQTPVGRKVRLKYWKNVLEPLFPEAKQSDFALIVNKIAATKFNYLELPSFKEEFKNLKLEKWNKLIKYLLADDRSRGRGRQPDLYGTFTGISAILESLQVGVQIQTKQLPGLKLCRVNLHLLQGAVEMYDLDHTPPMKKLNMQTLVKGGYIKKPVTCRYGGSYSLKGWDVLEIHCSFHGFIYRQGTQSDTRRTVDISSLKGPKAPSHPWKKMIKDWSISIPQPYFLVPEDCVFIHFPDYSHFRRFFDFFDDWGSGLAQIFAGNSQSYQLEEKVKKQLLLKTDLMTRLMADLVIKDIIFLSEDPFIFEGNAHAVVLKIQNEFLLQEKLSYNLANFKKDYPEISEETRNIDGLPVQCLTSADFRFRSFRFKLKDYFVITNSLQLAGKIMATEQKKKKSVAANLDLHYFLEHIKHRFAETEYGFIFLSDAFIRKILSPAYKVAEKRRLECLQNMSLLTFDRLFWLQRKNKFKVSGLSGLVSCPEGGQYEAQAREVHCSFHRSFGRLKPVSEILPQKVSERESLGYKAFVKDYSNYFQRFFDPIGLAFVTRPHFKGRLLIMPLIENGLYNGLKNNIKEEDIKFGPDSKDSIVKLGINFNVKNLVTPRRSANISAENYKQAQAIKHGISGSFWWHILDHNLLLHWNANFATAEILQSFGRFRANRFSPFMPLVISILTPSFFALELNSEDFFKEIVERIEKKIFYHNQARMRWSPKVTLHKIATKNSASLYVLHFEFFFLEKNFYFKKWRNYFLFSSQRRAFENLVPHKEKSGFRPGNFNLIFHPGRLNRMRKDFIEHRGKGHHKSCMGNLKKLQKANPFTNTEKFLKNYQAIFKSMPLCPDGGQYQREKNGAFFCNKHGSLKKSIQLEDEKLLHKVRNIQIGSFIESEGFQSLIELK
ncbi:hypothetical protein ACFL35_13500 [Candidatus Riflebacteria bacterium]